MSVWMTDKQANSEDGMRSSSEVIYQCMIAT